jgi:hypothetical protein
MTVSYDLCEWVIYCAEFLVTTICISFMPFSGQLLWVFRTNPNVYTNPTIIQHCPSHSTFQNGCCADQLQSTASFRVDA